MEINRCVGCMNELKPGERYCPVCGCDNLNIEQPSYALRPHTILHGRYLIGKVLGKGGFGITYIGLDLTLNVKVAVKEYFPMGEVSREQGHSAALRWNPSRAGTEHRQKGYDSFLKEARKMAKIDQIPSIVRVRDTFLENETAYIVMDYAEGVTLKEKLLKNGTMTFSECVQLFSPMIEDLAKVHKQGMIHRDISPDNIMVQPDGSVRLLDLGAAKDTTAAQGPESQLVTKKGFSPLEQYMDAGKIGPWTDVYALCATIYYCLTGKVLPASMDRIDHEELQFPEKMREPLSPKAAGALKAGLAVKPEKRIKSMEELLQRLQSGKPPKPPKPKWLRLALAAACIALVLGAGIFLAGRGGGVTVERMGNSNANMLNYGGFAVIANEYEYFIGADNALYMCAYDKEEQTFYMGDSQKMADYGAYINLSEESVYYITTDYVENAIYRMNLDGTEAEKILVSEDGKFFGCMQYAALSNGEEYLYYTLEKEPGTYLYELYRYNLKDGVSELLTDDDVVWFNLYGSSLYMILAQDIGTDPKSVLVRADLEAGEQEILDDEKMYSRGFVEEDTMFLYSDKQESLVVCDLDGEEDSSLEGFYDIDIDPNGTIGYGEGWIYYASREDQQIHRVRANGTGDRVVIENHTGVNICYDDHALWFIAQNGEEYTSEIQLYIAGADGSYIFELFEPESGWRLPEAMIADFDYEKSGDGIAITGYHGKRKEFSIPDEIEGLPVKTIAEEAFMESDVVRVGLPQTVETIETQAFCTCTSLQFIGLPEGLVEIGIGAFGACFSLTQVEFLESLQKIGGLAFHGTPLSEVYIPANVESIETGAFSLSQDAKLTEFKVSEENERFYQQDGVLYVTEEDIKLLVSYPQGREGEFAIPDDVDGIAPYAFANCHKMTSVKIPESVIRIFENAFYNCEHLGTISVAKGCQVEDLGDNSPKVEYY